MTPNQEGGYCIVWSGAKASFSLFWKDAGSKSAKRSNQRGATRNQSEGNESFEAQVNSNQVSWLPIVGIRRAVVMLGDVYFSASFGLFMHFILLQTTYDSCT